MVDKQKETEERAKKVKELGVPVEFNGKKIGKGEKIVLGNGDGMPTGLIHAVGSKKKGEEWGR